MPKILKTYRLTPEVDALVKAEAERLSELQGVKVAEADVIALAVIKWCSPSSTPSSSTDAPASVTPAGLKPRAESVAERKARQAKEHAAQLAQSDVLAREMERTDIDYDLENVTNRSAPIATRPDKPPVRHHYEVTKRRIKPLVRPHGSTEAKAKRS